jgi:hypothetical protein
MIERTMIHFERKLTSTRQAIPSTQRFHIDIDIDIDIDGGVSEILSEMRRLADFEPFRSSEQRDQREKSSARNFAAQ